MALRYMGNKGNPAVLLVGAYARRRPASGRVARDGGKYLVCPLS